MLTASMHIERLKLALSYYRNQRQRCLPSNVLQTASHFHTSMMWWCGGSGGGGSGGGSDGGSGGRSDSCDDHHS